MGFRSLQECVFALEKEGQLIRVADEIDPKLEMGEIQRRMFRKQGPAILFERPKGTRFPMLANLFGTLDRARFLFRDTLKGVARLVELKADPANAASLRWSNWQAHKALTNMRPSAAWSAPVMAESCRISDLPALQSWPKDGGPFITLPQVYTEDPRAPGWRKSNLGMYRIQLAGNDYQVDREVGLHFQIHRGIGVHQCESKRLGKPLAVNIHVGGPPSLTFSAVMPLPEGLSELMFAGALGGRRVRLAKAPNGISLLAESDFCICGVIDPDRLAPEGPFGDHLGYYSLRHDFPVVRVEKVFHRRDAIWPFTTVGRPPQEDTIFGELIHELTGPIIPAVLPGVKGVHAVDASGVHPLLLAIGSERYAPFMELSRPQELLTQANAILGQGQMSLAKYLLIVSEHDDPALDVHDIESFFRHLLERVDWSRDLHFQTCTTIDTLDYSGTAINEGSKLVMSAVGKPRRQLAARVAGDVAAPWGTCEPRVCFPGALAVQAPSFAASPRAAEAFCQAQRGRNDLEGFPLVIIADDSSFTAETLANFLWETFTRSNPSHDVHGIDSFVEHKHWGCRGSLVIDARTKPHHAPPLEMEQNVLDRVDRLFARGGPFAKWG